MGTDGPQGIVLPVYFVGDVSWSMEGVPIDSLNGALSELRDAVAKAPSMKQAVQLGIVTFADSAATVHDLAPLSDDMTLPTLECQGRGTNYTAVLRHLKHQIPADVQSLKGRFDSVKRPLVFFLSDGEPNTDKENWGQALSELKDPGFHERPNVLAFGIGEADPEVIKTVASETKYAWVAASSTSTADAIAEFGKAFFKSMSASADAMARGDDTTFVPEPEGFVSLKSDTL